MQSRIGVGHPRRALIRHAGAAGLGQLNFDPGCARVGNIEGGIEVISESTNQCQFHDNSSHGKKRSKSFHTTLYRVS